MSQRTLVALAGQPNSGKSTIFNTLTGARQHVANYPGVTVDKKTGFFTAQNKRIELVDLPGTYNFTSYSMEERAARDFVLLEQPGLIVNVADASNLRRHLYLTLQLLEMQIPLILAINMIDIAKRRGINIDIQGLSAALRVPVIPTVGNKSQGVSELKKALAKGGDKTQKSNYSINYGVLESSISKLQEALAEHGQILNTPVRWLALKLLEGDSTCEDLLIKHLGAEKSTQILSQARELREAFSKSEGRTVEKHIAYTRHNECVQLAGQYVHTPKTKGKTLTDKADAIICHRFVGPVVLLAILFALYQIAIVYGNHLAAQIWPFWDWAQSSLASLLPNAGFLEDPLLRALGVWCMKSVTAVLNYLPIFFLLFGLVAVLEDSGYMPRMAFILDRVFRSFGLHGQSTLPLVLGGIYVGGCAIPAIMATKAIPDERARMATILITPMMNCLAKTPLYLVMIGAYFSEHAGAAMFFIATITMLMALPVAKLLSLTVLRNKPSAPFIMELPPYHIPSLRFVLMRAIERCWMFAKKVLTVVLAVAIVLFALITFPSLSDERLAHYHNQMNNAQNTFMKAVAQTSLAGSFTQDDITDLILFEETLKAAKRGITSQDEASKIDERFKTKNELLFTIARAQGADGKALRSPLRKLISSRKQLRREMREEVFENSVLGRLGKALEPVTQYAGFSWRINIALLSAFAAKENSAATIGAIYGLDGDNINVQESIKTGEVGFTALHALALMLFMALYPPCVPASVMVRVQTHSTSWMLFSIVYQMTLGIIVATCVFSGGKALGLSGWQAMWAFYALCALLTIILGLVPQRRDKSLNIETNFKTAKN